MKHIQITTITLLYFAGLLTLPAYLLTYLLTYTLSYIHAYPLTNLPTYALAHLRAYLLTCAWHWGLARAADHAGWRMQPARAVA